MLRVIPSQSHFYLLHLPPFGQPADLVELVFEPNMVKVKRRNTCTNATLLATGEKHIIVLFFPYEHTALLTI